jgi:cell division protein FtsL
MGWLILLLSSLSLVTWRQARGLELEQALREAEVERAIADSDRRALTRGVEELRSRSRIIRVARDRLGLQLPGDADIVFLPVVTP